VLQFTGFDLILCRNVLIYFHTEAAERIVEALGRCLDPDGWLLLGHAETIPQFGRSLQRVDLPGVTAYRASAPAQPAPEPPPVFAPPAPPARPAREEPAARRPAAPPRPPAREPAPAPRAPAAPADALARLRAEADAGAFDKAADLARALAAALPSAPAPHYYEGLMARARDATGEAERSFRRAIYLDGGFAMAHYQLGLLLLGVGRSADARKALRNAARAAGAAAPDALLPEGDGLSAGALRALTRAALSSLEAR
jgi:chemotaxis protein methyltransferase CheR